MRPKHPDTNHPEGGEGNDLTGEIAAALVAATGLLCAAHVAAAEESGSVRLIRTYVQDYTTVDHDGVTYTAGTLEGVVTILESSGGPFVAGAHDSATCVAYVKRSEAGFDLEVPCEATAPSGDRWYTLSERRAGDIEAGGGGPGDMKIVGGTGAYAGMSGSCTYDVDYLPGDWVIMIADCTWQKP